MACELNKLADPSRPSRSVTWCRATCVPDPPLRSATWWPRRLSGAVPNRTICRPASRRYPVVIVCAVTTWRDREPQEGGQRPRSRCRLCRSCVLVLQQHLLRLPFAGRLLGRAIDGTRPSCGRERVKQEMLVSEVDSPPQTCCGRLHDGGCPGARSRCGRRLTR